MANEPISETAEPRAITLFPPRLYDAVDGGLGYDDIARNPERIVVFNTGPWGDIKPGDVVEILWGPNLDSVGRHHYVAGENFSPQIHVKAAALSRYGEGSMQMAAQLTTFDRDQTYRTPSVPVSVKLSVPGGLDPDPESPHRNEALAIPRVPETIPGDLSGVVVHVPVYKNMSEGDRITLQWHAEILRHEALDKDEVGHPVRFEIDKDIIALGAGADVEVRYAIHDRVANWSLWSPAAIASIPPGEESPKAPWVLGTVGDEGDELDLGRQGSKDVIVRVEGHLAVAGDTVVVSWEGVTSTGSKLAYVTPPQRVVRPGQTMDFPVPHENVSPLGSGYASVGYTISSGTGTVVKSQRRRISVLAAPRVLPAPTITEAVDHTLDPRNAHGGVHVIVPAWDGVSPNDRCYLDWTGRTHDGRYTYYRAAMSGADMLPDRTLRFTVPEDEAVRLAGGSLSVKYAVAVQVLARYPDGSRIEPLAHLESPPVELDVLNVPPALSIDSSPVTLSGAMIRTEKRVTVPPAGASVARMATGGVPPYRYSASSGAVEVDEATGRVVSLRNGDAVVTVTDAKGATVFYPVKISGVLHFLDLESNSTFSTAGAQAGSRGARLPSLAEWDALRAAYGGAPDMRQDAGWSSQQFDAKSHYVVYPATGAREVRKTFGLGAPLGLAWAWGVFAPTA